MEKEDSTVKRKSDWWEPEWTPYVVTFLVLGGAAGNIFAARRLIHFIRTRKPHDGSAGNKTNQTNYNHLYTANGSHTSRQNQKSTAFRGQS